MKIRLLLFFLLTQSASTAIYSQQLLPSKKIVIAGEVPPGYTGENINIVTLHADAMTYSDFVLVPSEQKPVEGKVKWSIPASEPTRVRGAFVGSEDLGYLTEPGDSVIIQYEGNTPVFSGKGSIKWQLFYTVQHLSDSLDNLPERKALSSRWKEVYSLEDYLNWNKFLNKKIQLILPVIEKNKDKLTPFAYQDIKTIFCTEIEKRRKIKFGYLKVNESRSEKNKYGLSNKDICAIFDTTMNSAAAKYLRTQSTHINCLYYQWSMLRWDYYRSKGKFFLTKDSDSLIFGNRKEDSYIIQYDLAKKNYSGLLREKLMAFTFWDVDGVLAEVGFTPSVDSLLLDYYNQPGYTSYKEVVKKYEISYREKSRNAFAPAFALTGEENNTISNDKLKGKLVVLDFWYTGCAGCVQMTPALNRVQTEFKNDTNLIFISVSVDKEKLKWQESIKKGIYTPSDGLHYYTGGEGNKHEMIQKYQIKSFPTIIMIDHLGQIVPYDKFRQDPRRDSGKAMINLIRKELAVSKDGPYVFYGKEDSLTSISFSGKQIYQTRIKYNRDNPPAVTAYTDMNLPFNISIKKENIVEPCEFDMPNDLFILSDIEGNYSALRKLLINNGITDSELSWAFGKGHLVFLGDIFDRGKQVTECIWLLYSLEQQAKKAGGYVHFIIGNHEIMNLNGDNRYAKEKYAANAMLLNKSTKEMYSAESVLGRWFRSKNIAEKVGHILFVHGGISPQVNRLPLSLSEINNSARPFIDRIITGKDSLTTRILMRGIQSPFWYRGYYEQVSEKTKQDIDSTLQKFKVKRIITGHSIVADTISVLFDGKVFNTDTRHAEGISEALYIKGNKYYRANKEGIKTLIYEEQ